MYCEVCNNDEWTVLEDSNIAQLLECETCGNIEVVHKVDDLTK